MSSATNFAWRLISIVYIQASAPCVPGTNDNLQAEQLLKLVLFLTALSFFFLFSVKHYMIHILLNHFPLVFTCLER